MAPGAVEYTLSPGRLLIAVEGVARLSDLEDLDVRADRVVFRALGTQVCVTLCAGAIDVASCAASFRKGRLRLTWQPSEDDGVAGGTWASLVAAEEAKDASAAAGGATDSSQPAQVEDEAAAARGPAGERPSEAPAAPSEAAAAEAPEVLFELRATAEWALRKLRQLEVPAGARGSERFKAEVGLAELALRAAEDGVERALAERAAGGAPGPAVPAVVAAAERALGAVADAAPLAVPPPEPLGPPPARGSSAGLAGARWRLGSGRLVGPGVGTWQLSEEQAEESVLAALRRGARHVDTAAEYATEAAVAEAIRRSCVPRDEVFVTLKVASDTADGLRQTLRDSWRRWGGQYVDCLMLHRSPEADESLGEVWAVMEAEVRAGRARSLGASNVTLVQLRALVRDRPPELRPAMVQLKCSVFHQGGYFHEESSGPSALWRFLRDSGIVPVGVSLFNPLHSCAAPLEVPLVAAWASEAGCSPAELLAHWAVAIGVCPLVRCSPLHAAIFESGLRLPPRLVSALSSLSSLTECDCCPAGRDPLGLRSRGAPRRAARSGEALRGRAVEVHSLESEGGRALNGQRGRLEDFDDASGRWQVRVGGACRRVRPENLALLDEQSRPGSAEAAGALLRDLLAAGGPDAMFQALAARRAEVDWAVVETVAANLANATARGYAVKQQVLSRLLAAVRGVLADRRPQTILQVVPPPALDVSACWSGSAGAARRAACAAAALLEAGGLAVCDAFVPAAEVERLHAELACHDADFEVAKVWVGHGREGAQLAVPDVRSDRVFWVCGEHRTSPGELLWDSAGAQPSAGLAPCRPGEGAPKRPAGDFPRLRQLMRRVDGFVLGQLAQLCPRLAGLVERSDAMVSIYEEGAHFQKHVDNPNQDGRALTSIVYLNGAPDWSPADGGELRVFPPEGGPPLDFAPAGGRLVLFWADRIAHQVLPARRRRMALTYWWFDRAEREAKVRELRSSAARAAGPLAERDEALAQQFVESLLSEGASAPELAARARALPAGALAAVAGVVGAKDGAQALEGLDRLSPEDLDRLRGSLGKMGLD